MNCRWSAIVINGDFYITMTMLAHNLLRVLAAAPPLGYRCLSARSVSDRLQCNAADISLTRDQCRVAPKQKRDLPTLLEAMRAICPRRWRGRRPDRGSRP